MRAWVVALGTVSASLMAPLFVMDALAQSSTQVQSTSPPRIIPRPPRPVPKPPQDIIRLKPSDASPMIVAVDRGIDQGDGLVDEMSLSFSDMKLNIIAQGQTAEVVMEARIANHSDRMMEGRFSLALPQDAVVTGYALDIDGRMIDGVLMDQPKAKAVYQEQVRGRIDPGLAEVTSGNKFSTNIYPIMPHGSRTIKVRFSAPMDSVNGLQIPLKTVLPVAHVNVSGEWADGSTADIEASANMDNVSGQSPLDEVIILKPKARAGELTASEHQSGRKYFQLSGKTQNNATIRKGDGLRIYWDRSLSRRDDLLAEEIALASALVTRASPRSIELVSFSADDSNVTKISDSAALKARLNGLSYRGGTSLKGLDKVTSGKADSCLLFSDGDTTIDVAASFDPDCRLIVVSSAADANRARLSKLARDGGGNLVTLTKDNRTSLTDMILSGAGTAPILRDSGGRAIPARSFTMSDGGWLAVGPLPKDGVVSIDGKNLRASASPPSNAAGALWAAEQVVALSDNPLDREEMHALAISHQVASPTMAFLVLENQQQYVNADIVPPVGFSKEWMDQYKRNLEQHQADTIAAKEERMATVLRQWAQRKLWWNGSYDGKYVKPKRQRNEGADESIASIEPAPPPSVVTPSPIAETAVASADAAASYLNTRMENIVVTGTAINPNTAAKEMKTDVQNVLSDQPYLQALDKASVASRLAVLAAQEKEHGTLPAFYFDTAEWFRLKGDHATAKQLLLSAVELPMADDETRQIIAFRLQRDGNLDSAIAILERFAVTSDYRPQPKRQLALALAERGKRAGVNGRADLERAFILLTEVALEPANVAYNGMEVIALAEANALIPYIEKVGGKWSLDPRLTGLLDSDARIVIEWTKDDADLDLHVIEPSTEEVYYGHRLSAAGGTITDDMTDGYGPEDYSIRRARTGPYKVTVHGFSPDRLNPNGKGRVMVRLIHNFGRANQREELIDADISFDRGVDDDNGRGKHIATMTVGNTGK